MDPMRRRTGSIACVPQLVTFGSVPTLRLDRPVHHDAGVVLAAGSDTGLLLGAGRTLVAVHDGAFPLVQGLMPVFDATVPAR